MSKRYAISNLNPIRKEKLAIVETRQCLVSFYVGVQFIEPERKGVINHAPT